MDLLWFYMVARSVRARTGPQDFRKNSNFFAMSTTERKSNYAGRLMILESIMMF